jgi:lipoate-protein ligase A
MLQFLLRDMETYTLTERDLRRIIEIRAETFDQWSWNFGNDPKFNITREGRFSGGKFTAHVFVENGHIAQIRFFGDFFAKEGLEQLQAALGGCRYEAKDILAALEELHAQDYFYQITQDEIFSCII